ncbi:YgiW/YdeI family stress tolerance OB fold protein [Shewanella vaxholmensis]|uniref:NirD/YgiW/YdeI family stress tolerance protein n=1 Tax=Shewanella vaxholmensis TaxID=3063535 RepID=A0ABU9UP65_9GAMM|nr:NirD/YgiW/YdeI family stress tolerance protein [Shewanella sp. SP1S1-4]MDT3306713.1 NirD/YgiW/YdeI family stress tolerance protein [Shewanella sp. SP1S1-4]
MNKMTLTVFAMALSFTTIASQAGFQPTTGEPQIQGGFQGPSVRQVIHDVVSALNASDDAQIELTGHIISFIGHDDYIFRDATGDIKVEIDDDLWRGNTVTPETQVIIRGEVDKNWSEVTIDADNIQIVQ